MFFPLQCRNCALTIIGETLLFTTFTASENPRGSFVLSSGKKKRSFLREENAEQLSRRKLCPIFRKWIIMLINKRKGKIWVQPIMGGSGSIIPTETLCSVVDQPCSWHCWHRARRLPPYLPTASMNIKVVTPPERICSVWMGGSILASSSTSFLASLDGRLDRYSVSLFLASSSSFIQHNVHPVDHHVF